MSLAEYKLGQNSESARMARLSINEMTTYRWSFEDDVHHYAAAGVAAIGVWRSKLSDYGEEKGIELLREVNLAVSSLMWAGGFTGSDGRTFRESLDDALDAVRLAGALRAKCLIVYSGARGGHTHNHARRILKTALTELGALAAEQGITLALEPMHSGCGVDWTFLNTIDEALSLIAAVECPHVKLGFDTYYWCHDAAVMSRLPQLAPYLGIVQLGDAKAGPPRGEQHRCLLGQGSLPLRDTIAALDAAGYEGYYDVKLVGEEIEAADNALLVAQSKQAFSDLCAK